MIATKDPGKRHFIISMVKSFLRLVAGGVLMGSGLYWAGALLILAEALGIAEEL